MPAVPDPPASSSAVAATIAGVDALLYVALPIRAIVGAAVPLDYVRMLHACDQVDALLAAIVASAERSRDAISDCRRIIARSLDQTRRDAAEENVDDDE